MTEYSGSAHGQHKTSDEAKREGGARVSEQALIGVPGLPPDELKKSRMNQKQSGALFTRLTVKLVLNFVFERSGTVTGKCILSLHTI